MEELYCYYFYFFGIYIKIFINFVNIISMFSIFLLYFIFDKAIYKDILVLWNYFIKCFMIIFFILFGLFIDFNLIFFLEAIMLISWDE